MITIKKNDFTSNIDLAAILMVQTKEEMIETSRKLDLYVSPNLKKDKTARRLADEILENPLAVLCSLSKTELQLVDEFVKAGQNKYITRRNEENVLQAAKILPHTDLRGL